MEINHVIVIHLNSNRFIFVPMAPKKTLKFQGLERFNF